MIWITDGADDLFGKVDLIGKALGALGKEGKLAGQLGWTHGVACHNENTFCAAEELDKRVQKLEVKPWPR